MDKENKNIAQNSRAGNQILIGNQPPVTVTMTTNNELNPLNFPNIVREVVQYLRSAELLAARLVNTTWNKEANHSIAKIPKLFKCFKLESNFDDRPVAVAALPSSLGDLVLDAGSNPNLLNILKSFKFTNCDPESQQWQEFLTLFGPQVEDLTISTWCKVLILGHSGFASSAYCFNFEQMLKSFPRLTALHLSLTKCQWERNGCSSSAQPLTLPTLKSLTINLSGYPETWSSEDWEQDEIWTILKTIVRAAPNLKTLGTQVCKGRGHFPGHLVNDIFVTNRSSFKNSLDLDSLELGNFSSAGTSWSNFFNILTGNLSIANLKTLKLPHPSLPTTPALWNKLFAWVSSTLVRLHLAPNVVKGFEEQYEPLTPIPFKTRMPNLRTLTLHVAMLPVAMAMNPSSMDTGTATDFTSPMFPSLDQLTLYVCDLEQDPDPNRHRRHDLHIFRHVSKLGLIFDKANAKVDQPLRSILELLADQLACVEQLEIRNVRGFEILTCLFDVYGQQLRSDGSGTGTGTSAAENIRALSLIDLAGYDDDDDDELRNPQKLFPFTGQMDPEEVGLNLGTNPISDSPSLKIFKNLEKFSLGFESRADSIRISAHSAEAAMFHMPNLVSLEFRNLLIDKRANADWTALPGRLAHFNTYNCEVYDPNFVDRPVRNKADLSAVSQWLASI